MKFVLLAGDETRADIEAAITWLRQRQARCQIKSTRDEIDADVNELLDAYRLAAQ